MRWNLTFWLIYTQGRTLLKRVRFTFSTKESQLSKCINKTRCVTTFRYTKLVWKISFDWLTPFWTPSHVTVSKRTESLYCKKAIFLIFLGENCFIINKEIHLIEFRPCRSIFWIPNRISNLKKFEPLYARKTLLSLFYDENLWNCGKLT